MTIISHKHKFIFLKTRKTASGALETALARYCGEDDILMLSADVKKAKINREQNNGGWPPSVRATPDAIHLLAKGHPFRSLDLLINSGKNYARRTQL